MISKEDIIRLASDEEIVKLFQSIFKEQENLTRQEKETALKKIDDLVQEVIEKDLLIRVFS